MTELNWPEVLERCFKEQRVLYSKHARIEMRHEEFGPISDQEVYEAICNCTVIETYSGDKPYPSALVLGQTNAGRPLHIVSAFDEANDFAIVITVYQPDPTRWENDRWRKE